MKKIITSLLFVCALGIFSFGQGIHFSQWYEAPLLLNPANAGSYFGDYRATINYRNQWASVGNGFKTVFASYDMPIRKNKQDMKTTGVGVHFYNDKAGKSNYGRTEGTISLSQSVTVSRDLDLAVGLGFSYGQVSANYTNLKWDNQYDGTKYDGSLGTGESVLNTSSTYFDLNMGFLARFIGRKKNETNIGVSMANLTQTRQATLSSSSDKRRTRFIAHAKSEIPLEYRNDYIVPTLFVSNQSASTEIAVGATYKLNLGLQSSYTGYYTSSFLEFGAIYRYNDAVVAIVKFDWEQRIQLGASYDVNVSKLIPASAFQGGFEISLIYKGSY
ncbi:PorP/SprF family type IX secretion system membrane protein [bacterium]|nr:PorP/SprF family type IX secretion system membrane protein [Flavobacteriales bacterium]MDA9304076.1 PorP/SprF family type IX secretion system membrane protein [bacterium]